MRPGMDHFFNKLGTSKGQPDAAEAEKPLNGQPVCKKKANFTLIKAS